MKITDENPVLHELSGSPFFQNKVWLCLPAGSNAAALMTSIVYSEARNDATLVYCVTCYFSLHRS